MPPRRVHPALIAFAILATVAVTPAEPIGDSNRIQGTWRGDWVQKNSTSWTIHFDGDRYRAQGPGEDEWFEGPFRVRSDAAPAEIDFEIADCNCGYLGQSSLSIYKWEEGRMVVATPQPGSSRPAKFDESLGQVMYLNRATPDKTPSAE
jgi:uncharacterized protein (TIGR03067 family)